MCYSRVTSTASKDTATGQQMLLTRYKKKGYSRMTKYHCYWFCSVLARTAGKFRTSHFIDTKHSLVPPQVEFWLIPGHSDHSSRFRWVSAKIPIPADIEIKPDQPILSQYQSPEETHLITAVFFFFFFSFSMCFILCNFLSNSCWGYFLPGSTFYYA